MEGSRRRRKPGDPVHWLPHMLPGATPEEDLHEQIVQWYYQGKEIAEALDQGIRPAIPRSTDQGDLLAGIARIKETAARLESVLSDEVPYFDPGA